MNIDQIMTEAIDNSVKVEGHTISMHDLCWVISQDVAEQVINGLKLIIEGNELNGKAKIKEALEYLEPLKECQERNKDFPCVKVCSKRTDSILKISKKNKM